MSSSSWEERFPAWIKPFVEKTSYTELAEKSGISYSWLRKVAQGVARPSPRVVRYLTLALGCSEEETAQAMNAAGYSPDEGRIPAALTDEEDVTLPSDVEWGIDDVTISMTFRPSRSPEFVGEVRVVRAKAGNDVAA